MSPETFNSGIDEYGLKRLLSDDKCKEFADEIFEFLLLDVEERVKSCNGNFDELLTYIQHEFVDVGRRVSHYLNEYKAEIGDYAHISRLVRISCESLEKNEFEFACSYITKYIDEIEDDVDFSLFEVPKCWYLNFDAINNFYNYLSNKRQKKMFVLWCLQEVGNEQLFKQEILDLLSSDNMSLPADSKDNHLESNQVTKQDVVKWNGKQSELALLIGAMHEANLFEKVQANTGDISAEWEKWNRFTGAKDLSTSYRNATKNRDASANLKAGTKAAIVHKALEEIAKQLQTIRDVFN